MKRIRAGVLDIAYVEVGPADGDPVILLHGFPYDTHAYDEVAELLAAHGRRCLVPFLRGYGPTTFVGTDTPRSGQQAALGSDLLAFMDALAISKAVFGGYDWGGRAACVVAALWPHRARGLVSCGTGYNIQDLAKAMEPTTPDKEHRLWYQYYFQLERGRAGLARDRRALCQMLWRLWSPTWNATDAVFARTAPAFDNPDFVDVVIHSYRHRHGTVRGDPALDPIEKLLAVQPEISVPTVVLLGADDGVYPPPTKDKDAGHFVGPYRREIVAGVGHNFPQEAPSAFADAILAL